MKYLSTLFFTWIFCLCTITGSAAPSSELTTANHDSIRGIELLDECEKLKEISALDEAYYKYLVAEVIFDSLNLLDEKYYCLSELGDIAFSQNKFQKSDLHLKTCLLLLDEYGDRIQNRFRSKSKLSVLMTLSKIAQRESISQRLFYLNTGIALANDAEDKEMAIFFYQQLMYYYTESNQFEKALETIATAHQLSIDIDDSAKIAIMLVDRADNQTRLKRYEAADKSLKKAEAIFKQYQHPGSYCLSCWVTAGYGYNYLYWQKYDLAEKYLQATIDTFEVLGYTQEVKRLNARLSILYHRIGKYKESQKLRDKIFKNKKKGDPLQYTRAMEEIAQYYDAVGMHDSSLIIRKKMYSIKDSILAIDLASQIATIEELNVMELEKRRAAKNQLANEKEHKQNKNRNIMLSTAGAISLILLLTVMYSYRKKYKFNKSLQKKNTQYHEQQVAIEDQLRQSQVHQTEIQQLHSEITLDISFAESIQKTIIPSDEELGKNFNDSFVLYMPRDVVSGDFYFLIESAESTYVGVSDCTGHGVPGAMVSMIGSNNLRTCVAKGQTQPLNVILDNLSSRMEKSLSNSDDQRKDGMDMALLKFNKDKTKVDYSGANMPFHLIRNGEMTVIKGDKQPIGYFQNKTPFNNHELSLLPGDIIYLFSDGYPDQFGGPKDKKFKSKPLKELLINIASLPMSEQRKILTKTLNDWKGNQDQIDDITMMGIKI